MYQRIAAAAVGMLDRGVTVAAIARHFGVDDQHGRQGDPLVPAAVSAWRHHSIVIASVAGRRRGGPSTGWCSVPARFSSNRRRSRAAASRLRRYPRVRYRLQGELDTMTSGVDVSRSEKLRIR